MKRKFKKYLERLISVCVCSTAFFCFFANVAFAQNNEHRIRRVVLDPGHGGKDPGCRGAYTKEKNVTLSVALKLGKLIEDNFPDVKVYYTRKTDVYKSLKERSDFANSKNADLFIAIHVNALTKPSVRGFSTWVMGMHKSQGNLEVAQLENSVIMYDDDRNSTYEGFDNSPESYIIFSMLQNSHLDQSIKLADMVQNEFIKNGPIYGNRGVNQAGFWVLWRTAMPSILVEMGFLTNPQEEAIISKEENQKKFAQNLFNAFKKYKMQYDRNEAANAPDTHPIAVDDGKNNYTTEKESLPPTTDADTYNDDVDESPRTVKTSTSTKKMSYRVQIMSSDRKISTSARNFKGHTGVKVLKAGRRYKYTLGESSDLGKITKFCKSLQKDFRGAFVVSYSNGKLEMVK